MAFESSLTVCGINDLTPTDAPALFTYRSHGKGCAFSVLAPDSVDEPALHCSNASVKFDSATPGTSSLFDRRCRRN